MLKPTAPVQQSPYIVEFVRVPINLGAGSFEDVRMWKGSKMLQFIGKRTYLLINSLSSAAALHLCSI